MELGASSISLAVQDLEASRTFYEKLGFTEMGGDATQNWLILRNGAAVIGLFQGMFPANTLTFNPGWDQGASEVADFTDIRQIAAALTERCLQPVLDTTGDSAAGPAHLTLVDPDGNPILIDQHR